MGFHYIIIIIIIIFCHIIYRIMQQHYKASLIKVTDLGLLVCDTASGVS